MTNPQSRPSQLTKSFRPAQDWALGMRYLRKVKGNVPCLILITVEARIAVFNRDSAAKLIFSNQACGLLLPKFRTLQPPAPMAPHISWFVIFSSMCWSHFMSKMAFASQGAWKISKKRSWSNFACYKPIDCFYCKEYKKNKKTKKY